MYFCLNFCYKILEISDFSHSLMCANKAALLILKGSSDGH
ncbi:unnamed protein product [Staurois parvus]|uniref:Uncharacterized protein n=1 Tax=Staurois parvus TaxID=386267 RepID=A0ABN9BRJ4_9NEOB|nr:unnamed protein product [Staurois parvus]